MKAERKPVGLPIVVEAETVVEIVASEEGWVQDHPYSLQPQRPLVGIVVPAKSRKNKHYDRII